MNVLSRPRKTAGKYGASKGWSLTVRHLGLVLCAGLFIFSFDRGAAAVPAFQQANTADGLVSIEAEHYEIYTPVNGHEWILFTATGYSGNCALQALPSKNITRDTGYATGSPRLDFKINFAKTGTHYIWGRGKAAISGRDSFHAGLDGQAIATSDRIGYFTSSWSWSKATLDASAPAAFNVAAAGVHTLNVWMREDGFVLDKILVTTNPNYIPTGSGPSENLRTDGAVSNTAPVAYAGLDQVISFPVNIVNLQGAFSDDRLPNPPASVSPNWVFLSGPASVSFSSPDSLASTAAFPQPGAYSLGFLASDGTLNRQDALVIQVQPTRINLPGRLEVENYLPGGWNVGYYDATAGNTGGAYRTDDVDVKVTLDTGGGYNVAWISTNEWLAYDVQVAQTGNYDVVARVACGDASGTRTLQIEMDGLLLTGPMSFPVTGGWNNWVDVKASGVNVASGSHRIRVLMKTGSFDLNYIDFNLGTPPPQNQPPSVGAGADQTITLSDSGAVLDATSSDDALPNPPNALSYNWTQLSGPAAATFNNSNSQDPVVLFSQTGVYIFRLTVSDGSLQASDDVQVTVNAPPPQPGYLQDSGPDGIVSMEAEHFDAHAPQGGRNWSPALPAGYSGSYALKALPNSGANVDTGYAATSPRLDFKINFVKTGTHYVWARGIGASGSDDSYHAGLDGAAVATCDRVVNFAASWTWSKTTADSNLPATFMITSPGTHVVNAWMREDGFVLDKIVITTNPNYTPTGSGPLENLRSDGTPPAKPVLDPFTSPTKLNQIVFSGSKEANTAVLINGVASVPLDPSTTWNANAVLNVEGENTFSFTAQNIYNLQSAAEIIKAVRDTTPPSIVFTAPAPLSKVNQQQTWVSGTVDGVTFSMLAELEEGANVVTRTETDAAGNVATANLPIILDTIPPDIRVISPPRNAWVKTASVNVEIEFDDRHESEVCLLNQQGANQITISRTDEAGNTGTVTHLLRLDSVPPEIIFLSHGEGQKVVTLEETIVYTIDGTEHTEVFPLILEGANVFEVNAEDDAGNQTRKTLTLMRDTAAPVISVDFPLNNALVNKEEVISK